MNTKENLTAEVEGDIEDVEGVLRITAIRLTYHGDIPEGMSATVEKVLSVYAEKCPAYQSVKGCIDVTWESALEERETG